MPGDYDGNGTTDIAVFRNGEWYIQGHDPFLQIWGQAGDVPVPGDYDGNGTTDIAVFRNGEWYVQGHAPFLQIWGTSCDIPQPLPYAIRTLIPHGGCSDGTTRDGAHHSRQRYAQSSATIVRSEACR